MLAITLTLPPHCSQLSISMPNMRFSRCAQLMARCRSACVRRSIAVSFPRPLTLILFVLVHRSNLLIPSLVQRFGCPPP